MRDDPITKRTYQYGCDGGCLRIDTRDAAFFFPNCRGDGTYNVQVGEKGAFKSKHHARFLGAINVKGLATISENDLENDPIATIPEGHYQITGDKRGNMRRRS